ncbi:hypothetical protein [Guptibacillus sedimenti]|uniref:hypothetical protein n=1 Tax=Guptibacillus sedimenti TaxID=3025680 RepID=UPI0023604887|nr:hypothetical protein [Pseudalkalibacillus sedimenti]
MKRIVVFNSKYSLVLLGECFFFAQVAEKEMVIVHKPSELKYALFSAYSAVSNGIGSFKSMKGKAVVDNQMGQTVTSRRISENTSS